MIVSYLSDTPFQEYILCCRSKRNQICRNNRSHNYQCTRSSRSSSRTFWDKLNRNPNILHFRHTYVHNRLAKNKNESKNIRKLKNKTTTYRQIRFCFRPLPKQHKQTTRTRRAVSFLCQPTFRCLFPHHLFIPQAYRPRNTKNNWHTTNVTCQKFFFVFHISPRFTLKIIEEFLKKFNKTTN